MTKEEIQYIYDYSKSKAEICKKLNVRTNQNGFNIDKDILEYFSQIGINSREQISKKNLSNHWLEIQKRDYELNPKYCEYCGKKLQFEKRFAKCCNKSCGTALGNKKKGPMSKETKNKIRESLKKSFKNCTRIIHNQYTKNEKVEYKLLSELIKNNVILNIENYDYIDKPINIIRLKKHKCTNCGKEFYGRITKYGNFVSAKQCCDKCQLENNQNKVRALRKKEIEEGTFHGWKSRNILSYPEKFWKNVLDNNSIQYRTNHPIKQENGISNWFLDFYIELNGRKIDLEIDGKQHKYKDRQESDIRRDKYIKEQGIEVYRIDWNSINTDKGKNLMKEKIDKFLEFIKK